MHLSLLRKKAPGEALKGRIEEKVMDGPGRREIVTAIVWVMGAIIYALVIYW